MHGLRFRALLSLFLAALAVCFATALFQPQKLEAVANVPRIARPPVEAGPDEKWTVIVRSMPNLPDRAAIPALVERLQRNRVRRAWVQCKQDESDECAGGLAFYPSKIAPVAPGFADGRLDEFVAQLQTAGIEVCAWLPIFHDPTAAEAHPDWRAQTLDGDGKVAPQADWLCPRNPDAVAYEARLAAEIATRFHGRLAALYTDFIRFDDDFSCVCPRCLADTARLAHRRRVTPDDLRHAAVRDERLWTAWTTGRANAIASALDRIRDALTEVSPNLWLGAAVLPFSAEDYSFNTQSGQDFAKMSRAGVDEIAVMGYWDDWDKSPAWLRRGLETATETTGDDAIVSCLLDADMSVWRTGQTFAALSGVGNRRAFFRYGEWSEEVFATLRTAQRGVAADVAGPQAAWTAVAIRIDTEPDHLGSYDHVNEGMMRTLVAMFAEEKVEATFITCARLLELQPEGILAAHRAGHEIGIHAYNHEQLDELSPEQELAVIDRSFAVFREHGIPVAGFGAPRNSITEAGRQRLISLGAEYDGSAAYDPEVTSHDAQIVRSDDDSNRDIVVVPFLIPNDYDARFIDKLSAEQMLAAWKRKLLAVRAAGQSVAVLDIHQWLASQPENLAAVREFIRFAKSQPRCRVVTLREAARHARQEIDRVESATANGALVTENAAR